jgi:hypothetical protein
MLLFKEFWMENVDKILLLNDKIILQTKGSISNKQMEKEVDIVFENFEILRKKSDAIKADIKDFEELKILENKIKKAISKARR